MELVQLLRPHKQMSKMYIHYRERLLLDKKDSRREHRFHPAKLALIDRLIKNNDAMMEKIKLTFDKLRDDN